jgi:hypothetical protein
LGIFPRLPLQSIPDKGVIFKVFSNKELGYLSLTFQSLNHRIVLNHRINESLNLDETLTHEIGPVPSLPADAGLNASNCQRAELAQQLFAMNLF